ncbi:MAG: DISARM system SNF2-like helicase DrmD [Armatimonas sp.]
MSRATVTAVPEQGQIAVLRQGRYVITDVRPSQLPAGGGTPQHLVSASSIEDDALGEEIQVIWETEIGAQGLDRVLLPSPASGFDDPRRLAAFLDAVRWGAASQADVRSLQAPFRSGITLEDYQLEPLVRALQMPRVNLLIADDVGLGKTVESGLVCQELLLRHRARRILIVCPSALQVQWRDQMWEKFGLEFRIVDAALQKELRRTRGLSVNPWAHFPRLITSLDFLKRERPLRLFRETLPADGQPTYPRKWDLLILDEAHNVAPSGAGRYAVDSQRTRALREIVPHVEHKMFLTATPHNGYPESFSALLELLDNQRFARGVRPDRAQIGAVMVRRLKSDFKDWKGDARFAGRVLLPLEVNYTDAERQAHQTLQAYTKSRLDRAKDETERVASEFVLKLLKKRLFSSPEAFALTLAQHEQTLAASRRANAALRPSATVLRQQIEATEEDFGDDDLFEEANHDTVEAATRLFQTVNPEERRYLDELRAWAEKARSRPDSKAETLLQWLRATVKTDGVWNDTRVILFTEYRATQRWLLNLLAGEGFAEAKGDERRLQMLYGGMDSDLREKVKAAFQADPAVSPVRILLATDAASEGIDLQNHCSRLVHYEIPWNPNRMEQRNGRVDRHGQREPEVRIYHFVPEGYEMRLRSQQDTKPGALEGDLEFLARAAAKVENIREDLGKVGPVIASQVSEAMFGKRTRLDTKQAEDTSRPLRELLRLQRRLDEEIRAFRERLDETRRDMGFTPENIESIVSIGLALAGQLPLIPVTVPGLTARAFHLPPLRGSWAECAIGLLHPHTGATRPIVFDHDAMRGRDDVVLAHLGHRLVQMCLRLLRAEVWAGDAQARVQAGRGLSRVTAQRLRGAQFTSPIVLGYGRLVIVGADGQRLHEELVTAGGAIREGKFERLNVTQVSQAVAAAQPEPVSEKMQEQLAALWPQHERGLHSALDARARDRRDGLEKSLSERAEKEQADVEAVLLELKRSIEASFADDETLQLELDLFTSAEKEQFELNRHSLTERLRQIPDEIEREKQAIRNRFAAPELRLFPVAVTYVVPEGMAS